MLDKLLVVTEPLVIVDPINVADSRTLKRAMDGWAGGKSEEVYLPSNMDLILSKSFDGVQSNVAMFGVKNGYHGLVDRGFKGIVYYGENASDNLVHVKSGRIMVANSGEVLLKNNASYRILELPSGIYICGFEKGIIGFKKTKFHDFQF